MSEDIRSKLDVLPDLIIEKSDVTIQILPDLKHALYHYSNTVTNLANDELGSWEHTIPWRRIKKSQATDNLGNLETSQVNHSDESIKLQIKFRKPIPHGDSHEFSYQYQARIVAISSFKLRTQQITYSDWLTSGNICKELTATIKLPPQTILKMALPPPLDEPPYFFRKTNLQPLDTLTFMLVISKNKIGKPFWLWLASAFLSALIGFILTFLFNKIVQQ